MAGGDRAGTRFGHYELRRLLGVGGMGEVYEAYDTSKERIVALKLLDIELARDKTYVERFRRESRAAASVQEPHVIPVHDWGDVDGVLYIDMRLVPGADLKARLEAQGPMPPHEAVAVIEQIASALDAAHEVGLVHRDVKPANILLTKNLFAYLVDFGIARSESDAQLTNTGSAVGSFAYMAPERFENLPTTHSVDIYALTCVLYECLTDSVPFPANSILVTIRSHQMTPPPRPSATHPVPIAFDQVIARGMAKNARERFATAGELAQAARVALAGRTGSPAAPPARPAPTTVNMSPVERPAPQGPRPTRPAPVYPSAPQQLPPQQFPPAQPPPQRTAPQYPATRVRTGRTHPSAPLPLPPPPPERRDRMPLIAGLLGALLVLVIIGIVVWLVVLDNGNRNKANPPITTTQPTTEPSTDQITTTEPTRTTTTTTTPPPVLPALNGTVSGTDDSGFLGQPGPRCNAGDPAFLIGRTGRSQILICRTPIGRLYYEGVRLSDGAPIELDDPVSLGGGQYRVTNPSDGTVYTITPSSLRFEPGSGGAPSQESMLEFAYR